MPHEETDAKDQRDAEYRRRILEAARALVDRNGIDSVNMYQIAQEAGIGQGTLYRRYEHAGEIYSDMLRESVEHFLQELESWHAPSASAASALERLDDAIGRLIHYIDDNVVFLSTINCLYAGKKTFLPHKRPITQRLQGIFQDLLNDAVRQGETGELDVTLTANFLLAALSPEQYLHHRESLGYDKDMYLAGIRRLFIEGLRKRG
ncbi:TetR/AcrR family transcriptional regulator [Cohnella candidum]|uniref:TetR/AcrR family transcriptional regulator n=1 Tax=Cohnella candidum TaxID=2674991 RepID=A0A3G3K2V6_9BACL|nr:TetR/AcrR family transcriptional regulator [Cohnella candidum]AYQ74854.1 TetR/AcrR family transcriptional regulator [Cohnella candidum]